MVVLVACNKIGADPNLATNKLLPQNVADLKGWFENNFAKTTNFSKTVKSYGATNTAAAKTKFANVTEASVLEDAHVVKWPIWRMATNHLIGNINFTEVPVSVENEIFKMIAPKINDTEKNAIRAGRQNRVIFNQNSKGGYNKKIISLLPSYNYLKTHNFDISNISFFDLKKNKFEGQVIIKNWNEKILKYLSYDDKGKVTKITIKNKMQPASNLRLDCNWEFVGITFVPHPTCIRIGDESGPCGSLPLDLWDCTNDYENVCLEVPDDGDGSVDCDLEPDPAACLCATYNIGCGDGGGDDGDLEDDNACAQQLQQCMANLQNGTMTAGDPSEDVLEEVSSDLTGIIKYRSTFLEWRVCSFASESGTPGIGSFYNSISKEQVNTSYDPSLSIKKYKITGKGHISNRFTGGINCATQIIASPEVAILSTYADNTKLSIINKRHVQVYFGGCSNVSGGIYEIDFDGYNSKTAEWFYNH